MADIYLQQSKELLSKYSIFGLVRALPIYNSKLIRLKLEISLGMMMTLDSLAQVKMELFIVGALKTISKEMTMIMLT